MDKTIQQKLEELAEKYDSMGQDLGSYLDGLLYARYLHYADYIHLETLLSLQKPRTDFPDELIFIIYHQITELYFKLINWELKQIADKVKPTQSWIVEKVVRLNRYWDNLIFSYEIMLQGMENDQFMKFRMSLLPASGFQSFQFRLIEIYSTDLINLVDHNHANTLNENSTIEEQFEHLYWKHGAQQLSTGKKTLTLKQFEEKYTRKLLRHANQFKNKNLWQAVLKASKDTELELSLKEELRKYDHKMNIAWPMKHFKSAARFLDKKPEILAATGGTNWQKYLPPRFQKKIFFPKLWNDEERENWGKI
ncbi:MAG: tryptophan 2,3-dioxygenase family protein [Bacteroidota bacterium]|nr:tryptophan 2,3-dioxygenase family protein [Bacteroidota bacterium]